MNQTQVLGLDFGGVILDFIRYNDTDLSFKGDNYLNTPEVARAIESVKKLNEAKFKGNIYIVSRHGPEGPKRILEWIHHKNFFEITGIPEDHFYPCAERHEKEGIVRKLGITHFVDDRAEVLGHMVGVVPHLYLFQNLAENKEEFSHIRDQMTFVESWDELMPLLLQ